MMETDRENNISPYGEPTEEKGKLLVYIKIRISKESLAIIGLFSLNECRIKTIPIFVKDQYIEQQQFSEKRQVKQLSKTESKQALRNCKFQTRADLHRQWTRTHNRGKMTTGKWKHHS